MYIDKHHECSGQLFTLLYFGAEGALGHPDLGSPLSILVPKLKESLLLVLISSSLGHSLPFPHQLIEISG